MEIEYRVGNGIDVDQAIEMYSATTLGARRPVGDRMRMQAMLKNANLVVTAWEGNVLVGIARSLSDFVYTTYVADLAVRESHQKRGIGKELLRRTQAEAPMARIVLLAAPLAEGYYPAIGFTHHAQAWTLGPGEQVSL